MRQAASIAGLAISLALSPPVGAQAPVGLYPDGVHVVRPGDTLEGLTVTYSGTHDDWRQNWRLNSFVQDPNLLQPGWRLRLLLQPQRSRPAAQVLQLARQVEARPAPEPWSAAQIGDLLLDRDGVRTHEGASAELGFTDGGRLVVTENSLVFLVRPVPRPAAASARTIEIVEGQADLDFTPQPAGARPVEVIVGGARASLHHDSAVGAASRSRKLPAGSSQWMVYRGDAALEAAGQRVDLAAGTGTSVAPSKAPAPPERLLPAPRPATSTRPAVASRLELAWEAVPGASAYVAELCADPACGQLVARVTGISATSWRPEGIVPGSYFWRATAVAPSGLDGFPAEPVALAVLDRDPDDVPPQARLGLGGPHVEVDGKFVFAGTAQVRLTATDEGTGIASRQIVVDGKEVGEESLRGPWTSGEHTVEAVVTDLAGNATSVGPLRFVVDATPPEIAPAFGTAKGRSGSEWRMLRDLVWASPDGWTAWRWVSSDRKLASGAVEARWTLAEDAAGSPVLSVAPRRSVVLSGDLSRALPAGEALTLTALDFGVGVERFRMRPRVREQGDHRVLVLLVEARDRLGNTTRLEIQGAPTD